MSQPSENLAKRTVSNVDPQGKSATDESAQRLQSTPVERVIAALHKRELLGLAEKVARTHHVTVHELLGRKRSQAVRKARRALYQALVDEGFSSVEVGDLLDRDHTTVLASLKKSA